MQLEPLATGLIYFHAAMGGIALALGAVALIAPKGKRVHKRAGKAFYFTMVTSAIIALIVSIMPGHRSAFLFSIGLFSIYFLLSGYRSLRFKHAHTNLKFDRLIAIAILLTGLAMTVCATVQGTKNIVLLVFGVVGMSFGVRDILQFRKPAELQKNWLKLHLGKMTGGYIAAATAFFVVNEIVPGLWNWFLPSMVGVAYIIFWIRKVNRRLLHH